MSQTQALQSVPEAATTDRPRPQTPAAEVIYFGLPRTAWIKIGIFAALFAAVFWSNLRRLWEKTNPFYGEPNWGHATVVPIIGLYYLYVNREALLSAVRKPGWLGLPILIGGLLLFGYGIWPGQNDFVKDFGMVVALFGLVALVTGWAVMRTAWFPIVFLVCGIPWPGLVYSKVASPLQQLAATVAVSVLSMTGVNSYVSGTKIIIYNHDVVRTLNVAEACAGLRSLMTFISVAAAVAFLSARPLWQKLIIVVAAIPIAVFCNVMRVAGQGLLDHYVSQQLSENFAHQFVGLIMLVPAFVMILAVGWVLDQMFVEESDRKAEPVPQVIRRAQPTVAPVAVVPPPVSRPSAPPATSRRKGPRTFSPRGLPPAQRPPAQNGGKP